MTRHVDTTGGFLFSYRYRLWSWLAVEGNYGLVRNAMQLSTTSGVFSGNAFMHQVTTGFVVKLPASARFKFSPYLLAGGGRCCSVRHPTVLQPPAVSARTLLLRGKQRPRSSMVAAPIFRSRNTGRCAPSIAVCSITVQTSMYSSSAPELRFTLHNRLWESCIGFEVELGETSFLSVS